jgi:DNA-binding PadR family transcriptional regulator
MLHRPTSFDMETVMSLLDILVTESPRQNLTITKLSDEARRRKCLRDLKTLYKYIRHMQKRGLIRIATIQDPRPFGEAKYYYPTSVAERLLQAWKQCEKEEKDKNGNQH